ncbi:MAG: RDD family protein [Hyphomicrobiaceae bacterium]
MVPLRLFISYRRDDTAPWAGRLYERLARHIRGVSVFMDIANIDPGADFVESIRSKVSDCDAMLCLIGKNWLATADDGEKRRIDDPNDFVHIEVASALRKGLMVIPLLVDGAQMPSENDLPSGLKALASRNAVVLGHTRFGPEVDDIIKTLLPPDANAAESVSSANIVNVPGSTSLRALLAASILGLLTSLLIYAVAVNLLRSNSFAASAALLILSASAIIVLRAAGTKIRSGERIFITCIGLNSSFLAVVAFGVSKSGLGLLEVNSWIVIFALCYVAVLLAWGHSLQKQLAPPTLDGQQGRPKLPAKTSVIGSTQNQFPLMQKYEPTAIASTQYGGLFRRCLAIYIDSFLVSLVLFAFFLPLMLAAPRLANYIVLEPPFGLFVTERELETKIEGSGSSNSRTVVVVERSVGGMWSYLYRVTVTKTPGVNGGEPRKTKQWQLIDREGRRPIHTSADKFFLFVFFVYMLFMEQSRYQATVGKLLLGMRVTGLDGKRVSLAQSIIRNISKILSVLTLLVGFIMVVWTRRRQSLHDKIAGTVVIVRRA